jgi:hypothetical protein
MLVELFSSCLWPNNHGNKPTELVVQHLAGKDTYSLNGKFQVRLTDYCTYDVRYEGPAPNYGHQECTYVYLEHLKIAHCNTKIFNPEGKPYLRVPSYGTLVFTQLPN